MYHKELDISHEIEYQSVKNFAARYDCDCIILQKYGPAGGNPFYLFSSENKDNLEQLAANIYEE